MKPLAIVMSCLITGIIAHAQSSGQFDDFGGVPSGLMKLRVESQPIRKPAQLIGTLNPPTLLVNGQPFDLSNLEEESGETGLWVNGQKQNVQGKRGQFYFEVQEPLEVVFRPSGKPAKKATVDTETFFLARGFSLIENRKDQPAPHSVHLNGTLPENSKLILDGSEVQVQDGKARVSLRLDEGRTTLTGKLISKTSRPFTLILNVSAERFNAERPVFRVFKEKDSPWNVPLQGHDVRGLTNPSGDLTIAGENISVEKDGRFEFFLKPNAMAWTVPIQVKTGNEVLNLEQKARCSNCDPKYFNRTESIRVGASAAGVYNFSVSRWSFDWADARGWSVGYRHAFMNSKDDSAEYNVHGLSFGWTLLRSRFDGPTWLEVGATVKHVESGDYRDTPGQRYGRKNIVVGGFLRSDPIKWGKVSFGVTYEGDSEARNLFWPELSFTHRF